MPDTKLICVLRDPIERAYSHYLMAVLNNVEPLSFDHATRQLIEPRALERSRAVPSETNSYIVYGEYARILGGFTQVFSDSQFLVVFSSALALRPADTLASIFRFIGVDDGVTPDNLGVRYRTAAVDQRIKAINLHAWQTSIARRDIARSAWHKTPESIRGAIDRMYKLANFRATVWNARRGTASKDMSMSTRKLLIDHYQQETRTLREIVKRDVPWLESWNHATSGSLT